MTLNLVFQGHGVIFMPVDALSILCAQLTRHLFAIAKFLFIQIQYYKRYVSDIGIVL